MEIKAMEFLYNNITVVTKKQMSAHMNLYHGYVDKVNEITNILSHDGGQKEANSTYSKYRGLKQAETFALDGVILHELYFENLGGTQPIPNTFSDTIKNNFSGGENWLEDLKACAAASRGWCILSYEQRTKTFRNISLDAHNFGLVSYMIPLIVLDMYEHAYFLDYATDKKSYINKFIQNINWPVVNNRLQLVLKNLA